MVTLAIELACKRFGGDDGAVRAPRAGGSHSRGGNMTKAQRKIAIDWLVSEARSARWRVTAYPTCATQNRRESSALFAAARALRKVVCDG